MSAACYHFLLRTVFTGSTPPDWPEKDTHRIASEKMSDGHVKIEWEDKLEFSPKKIVRLQCVNQSSLTEKCKNQRLTLAFSR